ncbi:helix-turn-helix domain-containing protein [Sulfuricurvum sp.]|uniref:helix-turn-helix domain-containing protein n=1 Tax=Sulfuricurvum sp. TaxID=2025608 RepID=UPI002619921E|nr:helix-turn-helix domain-containing protein [Sulfuricurvum sp.]MDD3594825.1 helix-turn-helix domain-containing protein [Sulfuricurvum sp.]
MDSIGKRVSLIRSKLNMSQYDLSESIGVSQKTISQWEVDKSDPSADALQKICSSLSISANWLLLGKGDMFLSGEEENTALTSNTLLNIRIGKCTPTAIFIEAYNYAPEKDPHGRLKETIKKDMEKFLKNVLENFKQLSISMEKKYSAYSSK